MIRFLTKTAGVVLLAASLSGCVSLLPKAIEYGLLQPGDVDVESLPAQMGAMMNKMGYAMMFLPTVCAWCKTPAA